MSTSRYQVEIVKWVKPAELTCIIRNFWRDGLIFSTRKKIVTRIIHPTWPASWSEVGWVWSVDHIFFVFIFFPPTQYTQHLDLFYWCLCNINGLHSFFFFFDHVVDYIYALWMDYIVVLLIMNLYFIMDMVNLWSVDFLMYLDLNIDLWAFLL